MYCISRHQPDCLQDSPTALTSVVTMTSSSVQMMFFGLSSAFITVQTALLQEKLQLMQVDSSTVPWINDDPTDTPQ
ncbi:unnamed protein product [Lampetra planeri]